ncbi:hypothetical protein [Flavivirga algicola]|uniref:Uncharacterized protein n=1 Tax=Flavivirga algicola TaxID=2729136 RepID=A0ABX1S234_9FLAO|nr:hypothetical protein [Flavivirga algicola]NMH89897.1 hypothetical protein [Flavivirga algicola]
MKKNKKQIIKSLGDFSKFKLNNSKLVIGGTDDPIDRKKLKVPSAG